MNTADSKCALIIVSNNTKPTENLEAINGGARHIPQGWPPKEIWLTLRMEAIFFSYEGHLLIHLWHNFEVRL